MDQLLNENKQWIDETWEKIDAKLKKVVARNKHIIAGACVDGKYVDNSKERINDWINGYWPGMMWLMYDATGDENYKESAEYGEDALDVAMERFGSLHHDVGFMWLLSSVANYTITGNLKSKNRALHAAAVLGARYNANGHYIGAWCWGERVCNFVIIDCMMNISLLFWASKQTKNPSYKSVAMQHADTCIRDHVREDGSVNHCIQYDGTTGEIIDKPFTQGYDMDSAWSRGEAWALNGYTNTYLHTGEKRYLDTAKKIAHYFIANICEDGYVPKADFMQPDDQIDTSAGAIAACGLIELAKAVPERESKLYMRAALNIMKALTEKHCDWTDDVDAILQNCSGCWGKEMHKPAMYGEYYYVEAMYKLKGFDKNFW